MASFYANPKMIASTLAPFTHNANLSGHVLDFTTRPNSIAIVRTSDFNHYIQPPKPNGDIEGYAGEPRDDFVLTGFVVVNLSKARRAMGLKLRFVAEARLAYPDRPWEDDVIYENTMDFDGHDNEGIFIDAGPQLFEYAFVVPSTLAGFDRTPYGRVSHRIQATLVGQPQSTSRFGSFFSSPSRTRSPSPSQSASLNLGLFGESSTGGRSRDASRSSAGRQREGSRAGRSREPTTNSRIPSYRSGSASGTRSPSYSGDRTPTSPMTTSPAQSPMFSPMQLSNDFNSLSLGSGASSNNNNNNNNGGTGASTPTSSMDPVLSRQGSGYSYPNSFVDKKPAASSLPRGVKWDDIPWLQGNMITSKEMWIIPLPTENRESLPLDVRNRSLVAGLGIVPWSLRTDAITVSGLIAFQSSLTDYNPLATVWCIRLSITQRIALTSPRRPQDGETLFPATSLVLFERGKLPKSQDEWFASKGLRGPEPLWEGEGVPGPASKKDRSQMAVQELLRMPDENRLRPSTCPGTITPIKVTHEFTLQFYFSVWGEDATGKPLPKDGPGRLRKAILTQGTIILSCCCTKKNLALPTYEQSNLLRARDREPLRELDCDICACGEPLSELSEREIARDFINEDGLPFGLLDGGGGGAGAGARGDDDGTALLRQQLLQHQQQDGLLGRGRTGRIKSEYTPP